MNAPINDGGPAFPQTIDDMGTLTVVTSGMSLRDWFAGQALAGLMASTTDASKDGFAIGCYQMADAMIAAREAKP